jgi:hypothetical protein
MADGSPPRHVHHGSPQRDAPTPKALHSKAQGKTMRRRPRVATLDNGDFPSPPNPNGVAPCWWNPARGSWTFFSNGSRGAVAETTDPGLWC